MLTTTLQLFFNISEIGQNYNEGSKTFEIIIVGNSSISKCCESNT
jgi:hypothetical protein